MDNTNYLQRRKKFSSIFFETALPNEYLVEIGKKEVKPILAGKKFKWGKKFLRIPAYVQKLQFQTDNANIDYQGIGIEGYATWRINPDKPQIAISTLDFFDENNPMAKTNEDLRTICIEAVRHVIANMTIEDALKNKDAIAENLKKQLASIEEKWGILFDQVGIEKVRIMSNKLFNDLQSEFRNKLKLEASKTQISTNRQIASEQNIMKEKTELERIKTEEIIELQEIERRKQLQKHELDDKFELDEKKRQMQAEEFRKEIELKKEKEQKNNELFLLTKQLEKTEIETETDLKQLQITLEELKNKIAYKQFEVQQLDRQLKQSYSEQELNRQLINQLPEIFNAVKIDNYSVLDSGNGDVSPVSKLMSEIILLLKNNGLIKSDKE